MAIFSCTLLMYANIPDCINIYKYINYNFARICIYTIYYIVYVPLIIEQIARMK